MNDTINLNTSDLNTTNKIKVNVTVDIVMTKTMCVIVDEGDEKDNTKLLHAFDTQKYSPEQANAFLNEFKHRKTINNIQNKINDLSGWFVKDKSIKLNNKYNEE